MLTHLAWVATLLPAVVNSAALSYPENCPATNPQGLPLAAVLAFYSDKNCANQVYSECEFTGKAIVDNSTVHTCQKSDLYKQGLEPPYYARILYGLHTDTQVDFTADRVCPPGDANAVLASLTAGYDTCTEITESANSIGITLYADGGSPLEKRFDHSSREDVATNANLKRDTGCSGFDITSSQNTYSPSVQVSEPITCSTATNESCTITVGKQQTKSIATSYMLSAGGSVGFLGDMATFQATFGQTFTQSETTTVQEQEIIPAGQTGFLSAYAAATLFKGTFTGCNSGDSEQAGEVLALKQNSLTYAVVITNEM